MQCPHCRTCLIEVPSAQSPQIDACPRRHGVWLDAGEMDLFVDNETVYKSSTVTGAAVAVQTATLCPRCATLLDEHPIGAEGTFACPSCKGCWVPEGVLTRLHETYGRGGTSPFEEEALYVRAAKIQARQDQRTAMQDVAKQGSSAELLYWYVIGGLISLILGVTTWESLRRVMAHSHWSGKIDEGFVLLLLGVAGGIALFVHGFRLNRRKRFIETTPTSTIRSLAVGLVEVTGKAEPASAMLNAPFSAMPCVFYYYMVEERQRHGKEEKWVTIAKGESSEPFVVRDATGGVTILPIGADLMLETRGTYQNTGSIELPPAAEAGLRALGIETAGWLSSKTLRCTEGFILPQETLYVLGTAHEGDQEQSVNEARLFIGRHPDEPFLISDRGERALIARMRWQVWALYYGGPALTAACLWGLLHTSLTAVR